MDTKNKPAPAQSREDEAQIIEEYADYLYTLAGASVSSETDAKRKRFQSALAALRSRQSQQATDEAPWHITEPDQNGEYGVWAGKTYCVAEGLTLKKAQELLATQAAAPQPSPQSKTLDQLAKEQGVKPIDDIASLVVPGLEPDFLEPSPQGEDAKRPSIDDIARVGGAVDFYAKRFQEPAANNSWRRIKTYIRARLASAQSSAQGEEAREMREAAQELLDLMDEVEIDPALGDETDRVFSRAEFARLRAVIGEAK